MPKKSKVDERLNSLFNGFRPEENLSKPESISKIDYRSVSLKSPGSSLQKPGQVGSSRPVRKLLTIVIGFAVFFLLAAGYFYNRFNSASNETIPTITSNTLLNPQATPDRPDFQPPTVPGKPTATKIGIENVDLSWSDSTDNVGVVGYTIYRNGISIATLSSSKLTYSDTTVLPNSDYTYAIDAYDQAGNHSAVSAPLKLTTPALPGNLIFLQPVADTYVNADEPSSIYGSANALRVDAAPDVHAYLRFKVEGLGGKTINRARLKIYAKSPATQGISVMAVADNNWSELTTNFNNAPSLGETLASSAPTVDNATWISLDITSYIKGEGTYNIGVVTGSTTSINLASREAGDTAPQLILELRP